MSLKYQPMQTEVLLDGKIVVEGVSVEEFELLGARRNFEPEWRRNDTGGWEHYEYGGERCYVPLLFVRKVGTDEVVAYSLNGRFVDAPVPDPIPTEWGTPGKKFRIKRDGDIIWDAKIYVPKSA